MAAVVAVAAPGQPCTLTSGRFLTRGTLSGNSAESSPKGLYRIVFAAGSAAPPMPGRRHIKNAADLRIRATYCRRGPLSQVHLEQGRSRMNNPNEKPGQQTQNPGQRNPGQKPGQQQQGGGHKPGQQQQ